MTSTVGEDGPLVNTMSLNGPFDCGGEASRRLRDAERRELAAVRW